MTRLARAVPAGLYAVVMAGLASLLVACGGGKPASAPAEAGKTVAASAQVWEKLKAIAEAHAGLSLPEGAGRAVGQKK